MKGVWAQVKNMKVLFITNIPSPYRVDFFNSLGKYCELTVCYERRRACDRDERWNGRSAENYKAHFIDAKELGTDQSIGTRVVKEVIREEYDRLIISGYSSPSVMLAIIYCRSHRIPYIIESDGGFNSVDTFIKRWVKKYLLCGAWMQFTTCDEHVRYLQGLGISKNKIFKYPFSSVHRNRIATEPATDNERQKLRADLGIRESRMILSVGQLIYRKGFDVLLSAVTRISSDVGVYIVGGTPYADILRQMEDLSLANVHFVDFKEPDVLKRWYRAADLFVLPTREDIWGLVINEAMAQGLPIVTTDRCIAGVELLDHKFIVPTDDPKALAVCMNELLESKSMRMATSRRNLDVISNYSIEDMVRWHMEMLTGDTVIRSSGGSNEKSRI